MKQSMGSWHSCKDRRLRPSPDWIYDSIPGSPDVCRCFRRPSRMIVDCDCAMPRICTEVQVMFFDTDCGGVVSNIAYLRFIETARTLLAEELGLALAEIAKTQRY